MIEVNLSKPSIVADLLRYPAENPLTVTQEVADRLRAAGNLADDDDGLDTMKVADLRKLAEDDKIALGDATAKPAIIAAIRVHRAADKE